MVILPLDTGRNFNVHKTFGRCPGRLLNALRMFDLHPVSRFTHREGYSIANFLLQYMITSTNTY